MDRDDLAALLRDHASRSSVPGAALGILHDGVTTAAYEGVADVTTGEPITPDTRFSVGSLTKSMVATVIAGLAASGRLSLDDPVAAHVPELDGGGWAELATIRELLANRSRIPLRAATEFGFSEHPDTDEAALSRLIAEVNGGAPAADVWSYSNAGWCVLGRVIETSADAPWEEAMRRLLFDPAGMTETSFASEPGSWRRVSGHELTDRGPTPVEPELARAYGPAGSSVISTVTDLLRFAALYLQDGPLARLRDVHAPISIAGWLDGWGLGWARFDWEGGPVWGWDGLLSGERSVLRILPGHRSAVVLMANSDGGRWLYRSLFQELMASRFGLRVPPLRLNATPGAAGELSRFAGVYAWPDRRFVVTATPTALRIRREDREREALPIDDRTFLVDATDPDTPTVTFGAFDPSGRPNVLYDMLWGLPRFEEP